MIPKITSVHSYVLSPKASTEGLLPENGWVGLACCWNVGLDCTHVGGKGIKSWPHGRCVSSCCGSAAIPLSVQEAIIYKCTLYILCVY